MALQASGAISLNDVNVELGKSATAQIGMNDSDARGLAQRPTPASAICMADFYGKSSAPTLLGEEFGGGYYAGGINACSTDYYMILSPNASGCIDRNGCGYWNQNNQFQNSKCVEDGYGNTYGTLCTLAGCVGQWAATLSINSCTDWYLPARNEASCVTNCSRCYNSTGQGFYCHPNQIVVCEYGESSECQNNTIFFYMYGFRKYPSFCTEGFATGKQTNICPRWRAWRRVEA